MPNALVIIFFCGCILASLSVILPFLTISSTSEWSLVICFIPLFIRYKRESPILATYNVLSCNVHATTVVPMPSYCEFSLASLYTAMLAAITASLNIVTGVLCLLDAIECTILSTQSFEAWSPALCPPMPSATINRLWKLPTGLSQQ